MMSLNAELLTESFLRASESEGVLMSRFYEFLFGRYPQAQRLFGRNSAEKQQKMLQDTLMGVIEHLDAPDWLAEQLASLGAMHVDYEVEDHMYGWVGESLVCALADTLGDEWTPAHAESWGAAYELLTTLALKGADAHRAKPAAS